MVCKVPIETTTSHFHAHNNNSSAERVAKGLAMNSDKTPGPWVPESKSLNGLKQLLAIYD